MTTATRASVRQVWPLLAVDDIRRSIAFYEQLGFSVVASADNDDGIFWCRIERDGTSIMLQLADGDEDGPAGERGRGVTMYFVCDDVEALRAEFAARGVTVPPTNLTDYGMRQVFVPEPDGYIVCFESPVDANA